MNRHDRLTYRLGGFVLLAITGGATAFNVAVLRDPEVGGALLLTGTIALALLGVGIFRKDSNA